jgi:TolA-binding protein
MEVPMRRAAILVIFVLACDSPPDPQQAVYRRAYDLTVAGKDAEARALYLALIRPDAGSRYQPDAHLALAELHFKRGELDAALEHYRAVEAFPDAPTRPYAIYKQGWCYLDQNRPHEALLIFERVVAMASDARIPDGQRASLVEAARDGLVKAYAAALAPEDAFDHFKKLAGAGAPALAEKLAEVYGEEGAWDRAALIARELVANQVDSPHLCTWQSHIVRGALATGEKKDQLAEVQRLGAVLARLEGNAQVAAAVVEDCRARLKQTTKELVLQWHESAKKTKDPELLTLADPLYRQYLARFSGDDDGYAMTFFHAEALRGLERWVDAYEEYRRVVEMKPTGQYTKDAAYGAVTSAKNAAEGQPPPARAAQGAPQPLSAGDRRLLAAFDLYVAHVPSAPELPAVEFRRARLLYDRDHLAEAIPLFQQIAQRHPQSELAIYAANLRLDSLNALGGTAELCASVRELLAGPLAARDAEAQRQWRQLAGQCASRKGADKAR